MASIFLDSEKLLLVDYLPSKKTITGQYYAEITFKLCDAIRQKCQRKLLLGVWLLHDNVPVQSHLLHSRPLNRRRIRRWKFVRRKNYGPPNFASRKSALNTSRRRISLAFLSLFTTMRYIFLCMFSAYKLVLCGS